MEIIVTVMQELFYDPVFKFLHSKTNSRSIAIVGGVLFSFLASIVAIGLVVLCLWAIFRK